MHIIKNAIIANFLLLAFAIKRCIIKKDFLFGVIHLIPTVMEVIMQPVINSIEIIGLYGVRDFLIRFENNRVILVGENGSGKTTISRIAYAVLSCNWDLLRTYPFERIIVSFSDGSIEIESKMINDVFGIPDIERVEYFADRHFSRRGVEGFISNVLEAKRMFESKDITENQRLRNKSVYPYEFFSKIIEDTSITTIYEITKQIQEKFQATILYLPTYRRIEEQLRNIFPDIERDVWAKARRKTNSKRVVELVEFGMDDVEQLVQKEQDTLKSFSQTQQKRLTLGYLSEIVSKTYDQSSSITEIKDLTEDQIHEVLGRLDSEILSDEMKKQVFDILNSVRIHNDNPDPEQVKIICHYFMKLMSFNQDITSAEQKIRDFQEKCNKYLVSNKIIYNSQDFTCTLLNRVENNFSSKNLISFQNLSSGEKQIVSLFSHLYFNSNSNVFVFIDEPELSLSVEWQKSLLPDIVHSPNCCGLVATTHSPFIFDNELESIVHGINEFCTRG